MPESRKEGRREGLPFSDFGRLVLSLLAKNNTRRAEASFDLYDDDNGTGSEPPPQDHLRPVSTVMLGPSFACFSVAIVTGRLCRPNNQTTFRPRSVAATGMSRPGLCGHVEPPAVSGGCRKAELWLLFLPVGLPAYQPTQTDATRRFDVNYDRCNDADPNPRNAYIRLN